jgi:2-oxo-4-hydroxy-4-carboxy-5-ureidoimidazoline decarboxylase
MTIDALNSLGREDFVNAVGWVFEGSPWVADRAWNSRTFENADSLHQAMVQQVEAASSEEQLALLRAHPDLGTRARVTAASGAEQAGAGLDHLTPPEFERLQRMNTQYRDKFGFLFLFAVKGSTKHDILRALEQRLEDDPEQEYREALLQVYRIARFRIENSIS